MKNPYKPLDNYEEKLVKAINNDEFIEVKNQKQEIKRLSSYFKQVARKDKRVTIRLNEKVLQKIQNRAVESGMPYQTLISTLLHQFTQGKIRLHI